MNAPAQLEQRFRVRSYEVEPDGKLRIVVLARMLQEVAWLHASLLGKGFVERESGALFWVLSRLRCRIDRYPRWGDEFTIRTWPVGTDRLLAVRDFAVIDADGVMGRMTSGWLVVDGSTSRPVRPETLVGDLPLTPSEFDGDLSKIRPPADSVPGPVRTVQHHDIDQYRHVNNAAYLEWMIDAVAEAQRIRSGESVRELGRVQTLAVDFLKELVVGEEYRAMISDGKGETDCEIARSSDSESVCRSRMTWSEK